MAKPQRNDGQPRPQISIKKGESMPEALWRHLDASKKQLKVVQGFCRILFFVTLGLVAYILLFCRCY